MATMRTLTRNWILRSAGISLLMALTSGLLVSVTVGLLPDGQFAPVFALSGSALSRLITLLGWVYLVGFAALLWMGLSERRRGRRALPYDALERMLLAAPSGVILTDNGQIVREINPVAAAMFGVGPAVFGRRLEQLFGTRGDTAGRVELPAVDAEPIQLTGVSADGERFPVRLSRVTLGNRDGDLTANFVHPLADDLTLAKSQRHAERQYQALFNEIPDGVFRSLPDGTLISANPALITMMGGEPSAGLAAKFDTTEFYLDPRDRRDLTAELVRSGSVRNLILNLKRCDGATLRVLANIGAIRDSDNRPILFQGTLTDLTGYEIHPARGAT